MLFKFNLLIGESVFLFLICISQAPGECEDSLKFINHLYFSMNDLFVSLDFLEN